MHQQYFFHTTCVDSNAVGEYGECIHEMVQSPHAEEISSRQFIQRIAQEHGFADGLASMFNHTSQQGFIRDYSLSCFRSCFQGHPCFYVYHSGVEHIFVPNDVQHRLVYGDDLQVRQEAIQSLSDALDASAPWQAATGDVDCRSALERFVQEHYGSFVQHNILLGSLFAYANPYRAMVKDIDQRFLLQPDAVDRQISLTLQRAEGDWSDAATNAFMVSQLTDIFNEAMQAQQEDALLRDATYQVTGDVLTLTFNDVFWEGGGLPDLLQGALSQRTKGLRSTCADVCYTVQPATASPAVKTRTPDESAPARTMRR